MPDTRVASGSEPGEGIAARWHEHRRGDHVASGESFLAALRAAQTLTRLAPLGTLSRNAGEGLIIVAAAVEPRVQP